MDLKERANDKVEDYSSGMKMKAILAKALIHDPPILLLDEPTLGLDPNFAREIRKFIKEELNEKEGKTIFLTTHYMEEADMLCDRIALIDRGKIIHLIIDTSDELKREISTRNVLVLETLSTELKRLEELENTKEARRWSLKREKREKGRFISSKYSFIKCFYSHYLFV